MNRREIYNNDFYKDRDKNTRHAAKVILDIVDRFFSISSMVDIGCGVGTWLNVGKQIFNCNMKILGVDGDHVDNDMLVIPKTCFCTIDLSDENGFNSIGSFDLAISLEVAEHLPPERANSFVEDICRLAPVVLFSAATRYQGGNGHLNEQRLSYWISMFNDYNYECFDAIRPMVWTDQEIPVWYRQNTVLFVKRDYNIPADLASFRLKEGFSDILHPEMFEDRGIDYGTECFLRKYLNLLRNGGKLEDCFLKRNISDIAIYGLGYIGRMIYEDLRDSRVTVNYAIDKVVKNYQDLKVYNSIDDIRECDSILITPMKFYDEISEMLSEKKIPTLKLTDIVD